MSEGYAGVIAGELGVKEQHVGAVLKLFSEGATVPFIARYRKEMTGTMDEEVIIRVRDLAERHAELDKRREMVLRTIEEQGKLTGPLREAIEQCRTLAELEDIYLPYKPKRKTRAEIARQRGLLPLARLLMEQGLVNLPVEAARFIDAGKDVHTAEDALAGARDIIAEWVNEHKVCRGKVRKLFEERSFIRSRVAKGKEAEGEKYKDYFAWEEPLSKVPSHRYLAMVRGENEGVLKMEIRPSSEDAISLIEGVFLKNDYDTGQQVAMAIEDAYKRLMAPSMETEMRAAAKERSDLKAIEVFAENVRQLLMAPPLGAKNILAIDPGFRTGCKVVCIDKTGNLLHNSTIYPHPPQNEASAAMKKIQTLVSQYKIEAIAVGNGTGGRETEALIRRIRFDRDLVAVMVNESGASVYSASKIAREEFADYDITVRGAVSIGRRLQDPLAELVKIDPKSIGVGQYQHDVDQKALERSLSDTVVSCVNQVGVDVNVASRQLLAHVSGIGPLLAANIVKSRQEKGPFRSREELKNVPRLGPKAFEQAAGFLRIRNGENPMDNTAVHPEAYPIVQKMARSVGVSVPELLGDESLRKGIDSTQFVSARFGLPTINDILRELEKPGRDPRARFEQFEFDRNVTKITDLQPGMVLNGVVTNITAFGAFVDIGVHQDGLIHISQIADEFVSDINQFLHLHQMVKVKVLQVEPERKRIQLTLKGVED
ncbi:MAG: Tex family protein [Bacteroidales bacterium]